MDFAKLFAVAKLAYTINASYCIALNDPAFPPPPLWDEITPTAQTSIISGVIFALSKSTATLADQHQSWLNHRTDEGWVYGETKDEVAKTHPCMVPYDDLPAPQRIKDALFRTAVLAAVDLYDNALTKSKTDEVCDADITIKIIGRSGTGKSIIGHHIAQMLEETFSVQSRSISTDAYNERTRESCEYVNLMRTGINNHTFRIKEIQAPREDLHG